MSYPETPFESDEPPIEPRPVLPSGIEAGLIAGFIVVAVFLIRDMSAGESLRTPSVLGTLMIDGAESARTVRSAPGASAAYNFVHFGAWILAGSIGIGLMQRVEQSAAAWYLPWVALAAFLLGCALLDVAVSGTGLGRLHLWLGGLAGALALAIFMGWRHPHAMNRVLRLGRDPT